jgi:threonine dehydratase
MITLADIKKAQQTIKAVVHYTPLDYSSTFSTLSNHHIYFKLENLQKTGSFKIRGAYNKIVSLTENEKKKGVIAASAGNHAQGVALASRKANISSTIVMPEGAPLSKIEATKGYGAEVLLSGSTFDDALEYAIKLKQKLGASFIHAFDDLKIIEGQGTVGLEIMEQLPDVEVIVCPIGGGGLISGVALAAKQINPKVKVYGVQAAACPSMISSLVKRTPVKVDSVHTIADGIAVKKPGNLSLEIVQNYVDDVFTVDDMEIARAMLYLLERNKLLVEGSGAAAIAALMYNKIPIQGKKVVVILSGGNVDINFVSRIIEHGLVEAGRYVTFFTMMSDKPGQLNQLLSIIANEEGNVLSINHHRISSRIMPGQTEIELSIEAKNHAHIEQMERKLKEAGYLVTKQI